MKLRIICLLALFSTNSVFEVQAARSTARNKAAQAKK